MILIRMKETRPADIGRDPWRIIMRRAHQLMGEHWHQQFLPDHFTPQAKFRYRHQLRTRGYLKRKPSLPDVIMGGQVDNVVTGYMMEQLKSSKAIRAYPSRVTIKMHGPRYVTMRSWKIRQPNKAKEIATVTADQKKTLAGVLKQSVIDQIAAYRAPRTTTI